MKMQCFYLVMTFLLLANCEDATRDAKWLLGRKVTTTKIEQHILTETVPSSCIVIAPSLPPCRDMRQLKIAPTAINDKITSTESPFLDEMSQEFDLMVPFRQAEDSAEFRDVESTGGWREYLGLVDTTVIDTIVRDKTTLFHDPQVVVTFSIIGCQPKQLPFDLDYCKTKNP